MKRKAKVFIKAITTILEDSGYDVLSELSSDAALPRIKDEKPDCVLIDIMMPGKDGLELCQEIKSAKNISMPKVIIVSAKTFEFDKNAPLI